MASPHGSSPKKETRESRENGEKKMCQKNSYHLDQWDMSIHELPSPHQKLEANYDQLLYAAKNRGFGHTFGPLITGGTY